MMGGSTLNHNLRMMSDTKRANHWLPITNITKHSGRPSNWFCMSMPPDNKLACFRKLSLLALHHDIKHIICLDSDNIDVERECWEMIEYLEDGPPNEFIIRELNIPDFNAGTIYLYRDFDIVVRTF